MRPGSDEQVSRRAFLGGGAAASLPSVFSNCAAGAPDRRRAGPRLDRRHRRRRPSPFARLSRR
jgi:hypothetical protein